MFSGVVRTVVSGQERYKQKNAICEIGDKNDLKYFNWLTGDDMQKPVFDFTYTGKFVNLQKKLSAYMQT